MKIQYLIALSFPFIILGFWKMVQWMDKEQAEDAILAQADRKAREMKKRTVR